MGDDFLYIQPVLGFFINLVYLFNTNWCTELRPFLASMFKNTEKIMSKKMRKIAWHTLIRYFSIFDFFTGFGI